MQAGNREGDGSARDAAADRAGRAEGDGTGLFAPGVLKAGARVGRYEVIELLGGGGTTTVYRALDPQMSRDLALAVLQLEFRDESGSTAEPLRLLSDTRALAGLSHPNVAAAYDVGSHDGAVFVAMEWVTGVSLDAWLRQKPAQRDVLSVVVAAGRGLAAAHGAGVLHRDFEPSSVTISPEGRTLVVGFGLARGASGRRAVGYAAPEQLDGQAADERSDQFSYAATAFAALAGELPFPAETQDAYRAVLARDERSAWPRTVPARIRRVIERGLAQRREKRYPSVAALVDALERASAPRRAPLLLGALGALVLLGVASAFVLPRQLATRACKLDAGPFQQLWNDERRAGLERAFLATNRSNAAEAFTLLAGRLDDFRSRWLTMKQQSCEATYVQREQTEQVSSLRTACLNRKLAGFSAVVNVFSEVDAKLIDRAGGVVTESLGDCADVASLMGAAAKLPDDPERRTWIADVESGNNVTNALLNAGRWQAAVGNAEATLELARKADYGPALALATTGLGRAKSGAARTGEERTASEVLLKEGINLAAKAGDDAQLAKSSSFFFTMIAQQKRIQEAEAMLPSAEALVIRAGNQPDQRIELLYGRSSIAIAHRQFAEAIEVLQEVERIAPLTTGERPYYGHTAAAKIGSIYAELGRHDEAVAALERGVEAERRAYGNVHPRVLLALINLAFVQSEVRHVQSALATLTRAKELAAQLPSDEPSARYIPSVEGQIWDKYGDCVRAIPSYRLALETHIKTDGPGHPVTAEAYAQLGRCLVKAGQLVEGSDALQRALAIRRENGSAPAAVAQAAFDLASALEQSPERQPEARALAQEALKLWQSESMPEEAGKAEQWLAAHRPSR